MSQLGARLVQSTQLRQELRINPRLYQAMELLYMPLLDLQQHLKQELAENPFLELEETESDEEVPLAEEGKEEKGEEIDWEEILLDGFEVGGQVQRYEPTEHLPPAAVQRMGLQDHLLEQLSFLELTERERRLGEEIIGNIGDDGYLSCSLEEVVEGINRWVAEAEDVARRRLEASEGELAPEEREREEAALAELFRPYDLAEAQAMLEKIQAFEPPGIAARDLRESLLLQLRRKGMGDSLAATLVAHHFKDLVNRRWGEIARALGITPQEVQEAADQLAKLDPKPGLQYSSEPDLYIIPDLVVEKVGDEYLVFANDTQLPRLRLSRAYREVARDKNKFKGENKEFIASKLNSASWMIQAIEQRRQTMLKVMNFIVDRQRAFFEKGVQYLKPLTLREVAEHLGMHESTVSRVTNEKYVQTPRGVFPLKFFFSSGLSTASGEDISARGVKAKIKSLVEHEDPKRPLTDQAIVALLRAEGIQIARRTVAKYRDQLGILPARMRKRV